jgi:phytoene dehydrogenase-like protein
LKDEKSKIKSRNGLWQAGKKVAVLERRHVVGGAAVTEELLPGYKFSRASYLCSLFRPQIFKDLKLKEVTHLPLSSSLSQPPPRAHTWHSTETTPRHSPPR